MNKYTINIEYPRPTIALPVDMMSQKPATKHLEDMTSQKEVNETTNNRTTIIIRPIGHCIVAESSQIEPKKLPNPYLQSKQHADIHHELLIRQRSGSMLDEKPELLRKLKERQIKLKDEEHKMALQRRRSSFELKLAEQARKILEYEEQEELRRREFSKNIDQTSEFVRVHSKIMYKSMTDLSKSCPT